MERTPEMQKELEDQIQSEVWEDIKNEFIAQGKWVEPASDEEIFEEDVRAHLEESTDESMNETDMS